MGTEYYIARWYREIKEQAGIEDERAAAILAAAYQLADSLCTEDGTSVTGAILTLADKVHQLNAGTRR